MKNVFIIGGGRDYSFLFKHLGLGEVGSVKEADLICFTGGEDVTPSLYGDAAHPWTGNNPQRDAYENQIFKEALALGIPCVGICRGAQFLNVMSGGRMYQHVTEHCHSHSLTDIESGELIYVSSTHHQMMMPSDKAVLVATANEKGTREWYDGQVAKRDVSKEDYEVVYYPHTNSLCFQPHPEFDSAEFVGMRRYFGDLLSRFFNL